MNDDLVEKVAIAIQQAERGNGKHLVGWESLGPQTQAHLLMSARAAISAVEGEGWQPIDTAPEGEPILVCSDKDLDDYTVETMTVRINSEDVKHRFFNLNSGNFSRHDWWTHWRPLPQPPVSKGEKM